MNIENKYIEKQGYRGVMLLVIFIWAGMLLGISFLEAPLKFHAPNITLALGLGIGRLVFGTLNKIEILFCISLIVLFFITNSLNHVIYWFGIATVILIIQTFWLLPALDARAQLVIDGGMPSPDSPHIYYVIAELVKLVALVVLGLKIFSQSVKLAHKA
jgi:hypothetical protein